MKNHYLLLALSALLAAPRAQAQKAWQPFRPGQTYQYSETATPGDTTHVFQVGAGVPAATANGDSLFQFNGRVGKLTGNSGGGSCAGGLLRLRPDNLFGATLRSQPDGTFILLAANGRSLTVRPRTAVGQSWPTGLPGLTAQVTSRAQQSVLAVAPDSVVTIALSDGQTMTLSKYHGILTGPSLDSYLNGRNRRRDLTLTALPQAGLGTARTGMWASYDFQPGDAFQRHYTSSMVIGGMVCIESWTKDSIMTRTQVGDSIVYTVRSWKREQRNGAPGAPAGFCNNTPGTTFYPPAISTLVVSGQRNNLGAEVLTGFYYAPATPSYFGGPVTGLSVRNNTRFNGRPEERQIMLKECNGSSPDSVVLGYIVDYGAARRYGKGLGLTYEIRTGIYYEDLTELNAFRKGSESWGTFMRPSFFLAARPQRPAATTAAFPNPFGNSLTATITLTRPQPVAADLRDALGRTVRTLPATPLAVGAQQVALSTTGLPAGIYTLHLHFAAEGRSEVLKVTKAE